MKRNRRRSGRALPGGRADGVEDALLLAVEERTRPAAAKSSQTTRTAVGLGFGGVGADMATTCGGSGARRGTAARGGMDKKIAARVAG
jgi:hypothetical protein